MKRSVTAALLCALGIALAGCAWLNPNLDARRDWQAADWYRAAKEELDNGNWLAAVKLYGELESKFPYGRFAQQAQLDTAYAYFKEGDAAQAISTIRRTRTSSWPDFPPMFYPVAAIAVLLSGISKGGFGVGSGGLAVPLMAIFIPPPEAAGIMLPLLCAMDLFGVHAYRGRWSWPHLRVLLPGALAGIALGAIAFGALPVNAVRCCWA